MNSKQMAVVNQNKSSGSLLLGTGLAFASLILVPAVATTFAAFKESIDGCLRDLGTHFKTKMQTLMTLKFQLFSKSENLAA